MISKNINYTFVVVRNIGKYSSRAFGTPGSIIRLENGIIHFQFMDNENNHKEYSLKGLIDNITTDKLLDFLEKEFEKSLRTKFKLLKLDTTFIND